MVILHATASRRSWHTGYLGASGGSRSHFDSGQQAITLHLAFYVYSRRPADTRLGLVQTSEAGEMQNSCVLVFSWEFSSIFWTPPYWGKACRAKSSFLFIPLQCSCDGSSTESRVLLPRLEDIRASALAAVRMGEKGKGMWGGSPR